MPTNDTWSLSKDADRIRIKCGRDSVRIVEVMLDGTEVDNCIDMDYDFFVRPRTKIEIADALVARLQGTGARWSPETVALFEEYRNAE